MGAYLIDNPGTLRQYSVRTNWAQSRPTGLIVVHTTEFAPVWRAEAQAAWIRLRSDPGSYHDVADSYGDDLKLVPYEFGAWQDGTGSNGFATAVAFICRTTDWRQMDAAERAVILRAGARAVVRQMRWLEANGYRVPPLRRVTKAQSDAGWPGFIAHGDRDPDRRTDPGTRPPNLFPWDEFFDAIRAELAGTTNEEDELDATEKKMLKEVHERLTTPMFRDGRFTFLQEMANIVGAAASARDASKAAVGMIGGLDAAVSKLAEANAAGTSIDPESLRRAAHEGATQAIGELIDGAHVVLSASAAE